MNLTAAALAIANTGTGFSDPCTIDTPDRRAVLHRCR
jgi:hypothetical protein